MIGLPTTTPTAGVMYATGAMYTSIRIEMKQLLYLHKIITKETSHWTNQTLHILNNHNLGWAKQINETLEEWGLEDDWEVIAKIPTNTWKETVKSKAEEKNLEKLKDQLFTRTRGEDKQKTKTLSILEQINDPSFVRKPLGFMDKNLLIARALIMGRYGMLQCGANFQKGYGNKECKECKVKDDESHRMNSCKVYSNVNLYNTSENIDFNLIYSNDTVKCMKVVEKILIMWDLANGKNVMRDG